MRERLRQTILSLGRLACTLALPAAVSAQSLPVTIGFDRVTARASRHDVEAMLMAAGLNAEQVKAEPLLLKLPDAASRQNVTARFTFTEDRLTELVFTMNSAEASEARAQVDRWDAALRKSYGRGPSTASTSPEGYQVEGWCLAPGVDVSIISKGGLAALDYAVDDMGACRDAPGVSPEAAGSFMYKLP